MILKFSSTKHIIMILLVTILLYFRGLTSSQDDQSFVGYSCTLPSNTKNIIFQNNLNTSLFNHLVPNSSTLAFATTTIGDGVDQVNAFYYCRGDVGPNTCNDCMKKAATKILKLCEMSQQGIIWYLECTLCYSNQTIFDLSNDLTLYYPKYSSSANLGDYLNPYRSIFQSTMNNLINQAVSNASLKPQGFATERVNLSLVQSLEGFVQCAPIINGKSCESCLNTALAQIQLWTNTMEFLPSCFVGFEVYGSQPLTPPTSSPARFSVRNKVILVLAIVVLSLLFGGIWYCWKCKSPNQRDPLLIVEDNVELNENWKQNVLAQFTYNQVEDMTEGFTKKLGEGGYAIVFYGCLSDSNTEVAVKVFSKDDAPKQFNTEIEVLGRISHKNLVTLIGYCDEGANLALIYEFMARGDLKSLLSEHSDGLSWKKRVEIAIDTAQGLDYLHNGCSPPIVHRDVKPANILLNKNLRAKVADFGFSKIFPEEYVSNLQTRVVGTPGYLDPQYSSTGQLNEKGDVYSFGVVLLELITGKKAILNYTTNLVQWVKSMLDRGDIATILDPNLSQDVDANHETVWKAVELADKCVHYEAAKRPTMTQIVMELKECLSITNSTETISSVALSSSLMSPSPC